MNIQQLPRILLMLSAAVFVVGLAVSCALASPRFAAGFCAGGALVLINAWVSARKVKGADFPNRGRVMASLVGGFYVRLILLGICLYAMIAVVSVDPIGLVSGLSVVPAGLLVLLALMYVANRRPGEV